MKERERERTLTNADGWWIAFAWFIVGAVFGIWAAAGFPMGVLL